MWKRDLIISERMYRNEAKYERGMRKTYEEVARGIVANRDKLKAELVIATQKCNAGYSEIQRLSQQLESCMRVAIEELAKRDKEIAVLKYQAANPSFGSTHTPAVQEKKGKRK